ncbi:hypothetical protein PVAND_009918 [Polypedilum vanderplanki]|uniref:Uncharacterized protein n=1 Tax=Polypedilum vanderplanki TaxID=319348 RepID=A0A9J6CE06_POLVA|nr:hypothetical protein PVAND_009918 [Polypedilum vanderplanki]
MTVGTYQRQQQTQQQQQFMTQRNFGMNFYAANQQQPLMTDTKGLLNGPGQNNCFLNCAVQQARKNNQRFAMESSHMRELSSKFNIMVFFCFLNYSSWEVDSFLFYENFSWPKIYKT